MTPSSRPLARPLGQAAVYAFEGATRIILTGVMGILIARYLGPSSFGSFSYALGVIGIAVPVATLGMRSILVRDFATQADWRPSLASAAFLQVGTGLVCGAVASALIATSRSFDPAMVFLAVTLFPLPALAVGDTYRSLLEVQERVSRVVTTSVGAAVFASVIKLAAILLEAPLWVLGLAWTAEAALILLGLTWGRLGARSLHTVKRYLARDSTKALLRESWPLMLSTIAVVLYVRLDTVMLGLLVGDVETGIYSAAARVSEVGYFVPVAAAAALRPHLARVLHTGDRDSYDRLTQRYISGSFGVALLGAGVALVLAGFIVTILFGHEYSASADVLRVQVLSTPFIFVGVASTQWFIDRQLSREVMIRSVLGFVVNVVLNLALIPPSGAEGAALATVIAYAVANVGANALSSRTRPIFLMQMRALRLDALFIPTMARQGDRQ